MKKFIVTFLSLFVSIGLLLVPVNANEDVNYNPTTDPNTYISDPMTYDEMLNHMMLQENITEAEAKLAMGPQTRAARAATYRDIYNTINVTASYKPQLHLYCQTSEGGSFHGIVKIMRVDMVRKYNGISKVFSGSVYVHLQDPNRVYYSIDGDFYNNGTSSGSVGVSIGVGQAATVNLSASYTSSFYANCSVQKTFNW